MEAPEALWFTHKICNLKGTEAAADFFFFF